MLYPLNYLKADSCGSDQGLAQALLGKTLTTEIVLGVRAVPRGYQADYPVNTVVSHGQQVSYRVEWGFTRTDVGLRDMRSQFRPGTSLTVSGIECKSDRIELKLSPDHGDSAKLKLMLGEHWQSQMQPAAVVAQVHLILKETNGDPSVAVGAAEKRPDPSMGQQQRAATIPVQGQDSGALYIDDGMNPRILAKDCCATFTEEVIYCKAWVRGDARVTNTIPHPPCCGFGRQGDRCSEVIAKTWEDAKAYGRDSEYFTSQDYAAAQRLHQVEAQQVAQRNLVEQQRCTKDDPRPASEQAADPHCVAISRNREIEKTSEAKAAQIKEAKAEEIDHLGLREGQSQATVRAILNGNNYSPWQCEGHYEGPEWRVACTSAKGMFRLWMLFSVYKRSQYLDSNTLRPHETDIPTDKLLTFTMDVPGSPY